MQDLSRDSVGTESSDDSANIVHPARNPCFAPRLLQEISASESHDNETDKEKELYARYVLHFSETDPENNEDYHDNSDRPLHPKYRYIKDILDKCLLIYEPISNQEALKDPEWKKSMYEELTSIEKHDVWEVVDKPANTRVLGLKWIRKPKLNPDYTINKLKSRLVALGYLQRAGIDYVETFAPVARLDTIKLVVAMAASFRWKLYHLDIKCAFLNGELHEDVYVHPPPEFEIKAGKDKVLKLKKAFYGLKQTPKEWYGTIDTYFIESGYMRSKNDTTLYILENSKGKVIITLYVDDILITGSNADQIEEQKELLKSRFELADLGMVCYFLGMEIQQGDEYIFLNQKKYMEDIILRFGQQHAKDSSIPFPPKLKHKMKQMDNQ